MNWPEIEQFEVHYVCIDIKDHSNAQKDATRAPLELDLGLGSTLHIPCSWVSALGARPSHLTTWSYPPLDSSPSGGAVGA